MRDVTAMGRSQLIEWIQELEGKLSKAKYVLTPELGMSEEAKEKALKRAQRLATELLDVVAYDHANHPDNMQESIAAITRVLEEHARSETPEEDFRMCEECPANESCPRFEQCDREAGEAMEAMVNERHRHDPSHCGQEVGPHTGWWCDLPDKHGGRCENSMWKGQILESKVKALEADMVGMKEAIASMLEATRAQQETIKSLEDGLALLRKQTSDWLQARAGGMVR